MKRIFAVFITIALMLLLTSCAFGGKQGYTSSYTCFFNERAGNSLSGETSADGKVWETRLNTYVNILASDEIINKAIDRDPSISISRDEFKNMLSVRVIDGSEIIEVAVTADEPETAYRLASSHAEIAPQYVGNIVEGSSMKIVNYPQLPQTK